MLHIPCDVLIVGTGAGGALVADALRDQARQGASIIACEAGPFYKHEDFNQREWDMSHLYWDRGATPNQDFSLTVARGKAVGGSTTVYTGVTFRMRKKTYHRWARHGMPFSLEKMHEEYEKLEREISAKELPDSMINENNRIFQRGCQKLGYPVGKLQLNIENCQECGFCNLGCRYRAMQNPMTVFWPRNLKDGVQLIPNCELVKLTEKRAYFLLKREAKLTGKRLPPGKLSISSKIVVLACGAMATPKILLETPFTRHLQGLGKGMQTHPATMVFGVAPEKITNTRGFPKAFYTEKFAERGVLLETAFYFPFITASRLPGVGRKLLAQMKDYHKFACILCLTNHPRKEKNGFLRRGQNIRFYYHIDREIREKLCFAVREATRIFFAGGCEKVLSPLIEEGTLSISQKAMVDRKIGLPMFHRRFIAASSAHPQGGCALGTGADAVCEPTGQVKGMENLFVADASLFPECAEVNPHLTVMLLGRHVGRHVAERLNQL